MFELVIVLIVIVAVFLVLVVLAQNSKGGGLASNFGGSGASQLMGVKKTGDILEKLTWGFAIAIVVLSMTSYIVVDKESRNRNYESPNVKKAQEKTLVNPNTTLPATDTTKK
jgi:preprotein translocase subunit SecG